MATEIKTPKAAIATDVMNVALDPDSTGAALTSTANEVTGGVETQEAIQTYREEREAPLRAAQADEERSYGEVLSAAWQETDTAWIADKIQESMTGAGYEYDPTFKPEAHYQEVVTQYGLQNTPETQELMGRAANMEEFVDTAERLQRHEQNQELLSRHGATALTMNLVDPVYLITDFATFGASRALRLGRAASASLGAAGTVGVMGAAEQSGKDKTGFDYVLGAAITGGAYSLFGGEAGRRIASGEGNWYGKVTVPNADGSVSGITRAVNNFTSEYDKLAQNPEAASIVGRVADDPVRRGEYNGESAASYMRMFRNEVDGLHDQYYQKVDEVLARQGFGRATRMFDFQGKVGAARDGLERDVATELLRRDDYYRRTGREPSPHPNPDIQELVKRHEAMMNRTAEIAKEAGVEGFEEFTPRPGYFHRQWNASTMARMEDNYGRDFMRRMLSESAMKGLRDTTQEEADAIADAILQRARAKLRDEQLDFVGSMGKGTAATLREMLEAARVPDARVQSIMNKVEQNTAEQGRTKYAKERLDLDLSVAATAPDGTTVRLVDMIDTDLARIAENYTQQMTGRASLSKVGLGGSDADLRALRAQYADSLANVDQATRSNLLQQFDGLLSDFTGMRPEANQLSPLAQRVSSFASSTMLGASGLWQVAEYGTMAARYGMAETAREFFKNAPGIRQSLQRMNSDPSLAEEMRNVLNLDLGRDVRIRPWLRQHDVNLAAQDTALDRVLHAGKQLTPYLNAMKFIHGNQSRMNANMALSVIGKASRGDQKALQQLESYGLKGSDWETVKSAVERNGTFTRQGNVTAMNWGGWSQRETELAMNTALKIMDDTILFGRAGQGASFSRSAVGQVLGQFRSFVSFAHNKLLRGTLQNEGIKGLSTLLAFQYPVTLLAYAANSALKGELDISDEQGVQKLVMGSMGYTAGLGFVADAAGIIGLTGSRGGLSVPLTGMFDVPSRIVGGAEQIAKGETHEGAAGIANAAARATPFVSIFPGTKILLNALESEE